MIDQLIAYESGELDLDKTVELFQRLIDEDLVWRLQGHYGRTAAALIESGHCIDSVASRRREESTHDDKVGTFCECGAAYDADFGGYACAK